MYAIRSFVGRKPGPWLEFASGGGVSLNTRRECAKRFPTIEAAQAAYRTLPPAKKFLIVCADEDEK